MPSLYLCGASVQGIQPFIFETSKLQEIAGASELVEQICTQAFYALAGISDPDRDPHLHLAAAGNIKYLFHDRAACARVSAQGHADGPRHHGQPSRGGNRRRLRGPCL